VYDKNAIFVGPRHANGIKKYTNAIPLHGDILLYVVIICRFWRLVRVIAFLLSPPVSMCFDLGFYGGDAFHRVPRLDMFYDVVGRLSWTLAFGFFVTISWCLTANVREILVERKTLLSS
jgi:hypothetical protein